MSPVCLFVGIYFASVLSFVALICGDWIVVGLSLIVFIFLAWISQRPDRTER